MARLWATSPFLILLLHSLSLPHLATATPTNVPPNATSTAQLGYMSDTPFNPGIYRDGGGGGYIAGQHIISFSDSYTTRPPGQPNDSFSSFVHNTYAYFGYRNASDPTSLFDFGSVTNANGLQTFIPTGLVAVGNETTAGARGNPLSIWPTSNIVALASGTSGLQVAGVYNASTLEILYNTMVLVNVVPASNVAPGKTLNISRVVKRLFYVSFPSHLLPSTFHFFTYSHPHTSSQSITTTYTTNIRQANENLYGSFSLYKASPAGVLPGEPADPYLYLFAATNTGIKMARVLSLYKYMRHYVSFLTSLFLSISMYPDRCSVQTMSYTTVSYSITALLLISSHHHHQRRPHSIKPLFPFPTHNALDRNTD